MMGGYGGPASGRMFGGLNNISGSLLKNLGNMGGAKGGGLGALGSILGGGMGGLGGLGSILGGGLGGLGNLANLANLGNINGRGKAGGNNGPDLSSLLGALGGNAATGPDLNTILSQLANMQKQSAASTPPPAAEADNAPIKDAQFRPVEEPDTNFSEERFQDPGQRQTSSADSATGQAGHNNGMPNINPEILEMLGSFLNNLGNQANQGNQAHRADNKAQQKANGAQNAYRRQNPRGQQNSYGQQNWAQEERPERPSDICFECPLGCPRAGLKLPPYAEVRRLAQGWRRY